MNKVILIGESHYHGLNLARSFGVEGIKPYGIVVGGKAAGFLEASKYWEKIYPAEDDEAAIHLALELFGHEPEKPLLMPWSDGALFAIDQHLREMRECFLVSSIGDIEGEIGRWMNKKRQAELGQRFGLAVSPTEEVSIPLQDGDIELIKERFSFPLFLKPVDSREGSKNDMRKVSSVEELRECGKELEQKGFPRVLVQEFLNIDVEYDFMGYCHRENCSYSVAVKNRTWPMNGGAACFGKVVAPGKMKSQFDQIVSHLSELGYAGPFDMDLFLVGERLFFNEINWRSSANVYAAVNSGNNYPCLWYRSITGGGHVSAEAYEGSDLYFMNEFWDVHHVLARKVSLAKWLRDVKKTETFAFYNREDRDPFRVRLKSAVKAKILRKNTIGDSE